MKIKAHAVGPDRFCPDCHRWLVRIHENGTFDLAAEAGIDLEGSAVIDTSMEKDQEIGMLAIEAHCLRCERKAGEVQTSGPQRKPLLQRIRSALQTPPGRRR